MATHEQIMAACSRLEPGGVCAVRADAFDEEFGQGTEDEFGTHPLLQAMADEVGGTWRLEYDAGRNVYLVKYESVEESAEAHDDTGGDEHRQEPSPTPLGQ